MWQRFIRRRRDDSKIVEIPVSESEIPVTSRANLYCSYDDPLGSSLIEHDDLNDVATLVSYGRQLFKQKSFATARTLFQRVVDLEPMNALAHTYLGLICYALGEPNSAIYWLTHAIRLAHTYAENYLYLGWVYYNTGRSLDAARMFEHYLDYDPQNERTGFQVRQLLTKILHRPR